LDYRKSFGGRPRVGGGDVRELQPKFAFKYPDGDAIFCSADLMEELHNILSPELIQTVLNEYQLPLRGVHGISHWARVLENGLRLAPYTGARIPVVSLFAVFHDSRRTNENRDPGHGRRGAEFAEKLNGKAFDLSDEDLHLLETACRYHTHSIPTEDITVQTCWDADRLDLGRVGIVTDPRCLYTDVAKQPELLTWAYERSCLQYEPEICRQWGISERQVLLPSRRAFQAGR
jgi:uncharacterized protein